MRHLIILLLLSACSTSRLLVQTDLVTEAELASSHVGSPDHKLLCPPFGQRLIILWRLDNREFSMRNPHLLITLRFKTLEERTIVYPLSSKWGTYELSLLNCQYLEKGGIETYKVQLIADNCLLEEWKHQLWYELITPISSPRETHKEALINDDEIEFLEFLDPNP